jgi:hypothetical protein
MTPCLCSDAEAADIASIRRQPTSFERSDWFVPSVDGACRGVSVMGHPESADRLIHG